VKRSNPCAPHTVFLASPVNLASPARGISSPLSLYQPQIHDLRSTPLNFTNLLADQRPELGQISQCPILEFAREPAFGK
jgi:hypothetical protein